jgi:uncharacterized protein YceK
MELSWKMEYIAADFVQQICRVYYRGIGMKILILLFFLITVVSGCVSTVELKSADEAGAKINGSSAVVNLRSGQTYEGWYIRVENNSITIDEAGTGEIRHFPARDVKSIEITEHRIGYAGPVIGGVAGGALMFGIGSMNHNDELERNRNARDFFSIVGVGVGAGIGLLIEVVQGHTCTYLFPEEPVKRDQGADSDTTRY